MSSSSDLTFDTRLVTSNRLLCDGVAVAAVDVADTGWKRAKGLLGRVSMDGALLFPKTNSIHTLGMKFAIDVAFCTEDLTVLEVVTMRPHRLGKVRRNARAVLEASAGAFEQWNVRAGSKLTVQ